MADTTYEQLPAELDLAFIKGDEFGMVISMDGTNLTGHAYDSRIYSLTSVAAGGGLGAGVTVAAGGTVVAFTITPVNLTAGQVNVSLSEVQTDQLSATGRYRWWFKTITPGNVTRTYLAGDVSVRVP
jgi:hypothetical protein